MMQAVASSALASEKAALVDGSALEFRAHELTFDGDTGEVELNGDVRLDWRQYPRHYQLEAPQVRVTGWLPRASSRRKTLSQQAPLLKVTGPARLTLCPCKTGGLTLAFREGQVDTSGDIQVREPTLRIGSVPVLWLPWLWLRSVDKVGLLWPRLGWDAMGGVAVGTGVHLPWRHVAGEAAWADVSVVGYARGGFGLDANITTTASTTRLQWDRVGGDLFVVRSNGARGLGLPGGVGWHADVATGSRTAAALVSLSDAAKPVNHANLHLDLRVANRVFTRASIGVLGHRDTGLLREDAWSPWTGNPREIAKDASLVLAPGGVMQAAWALLPGVAASVRASAWRVGLGQEQALDVAGVEAALTAGQWLGPLRLSYRENLAVFGNGLAHIHTADLLLSHHVELALPLGRVYGRALHKIEPFVSGQGLAASRKGVGAVNLRPEALSNGLYAMGLVGLRNAYGQQTDNPWLSWQVAVGQTAKLNAANNANPADTRPWQSNRGPAVAHTRAAFRAGWLYADAVAVAAKLRQYHGAMAVGDLGIAREQDLGMGVSLATQWRDAPWPAAWLTAAQFGWTVAPQLTGNGTSLTAKGMLPIGRPVVLDAGTYWDVTRGTWIGFDANLVWSHPCRCFSLRTGVSRRKGRPGADGWIGLDLVSQ